MYVKIGIVSSLQQEEPLLTTVTLFTTFFFHFKPSINFLTYETVNSSE